MSIRLALPGCSRPFRIAEDTIECSAQLHLRKDMLAALAEPVLVGALERRIAQLESQLEGIPEITDAQSRSFLQELD